MKRVLYLIFLLAVVLSACKMIQPPQPIHSYEEYAVKAKPSNLNLTLSSDIAQIETFINKKVNGLIYEDNDRNNNNNDNLLVKAWKSDRIELGLEGNELTWEVPLKLWIKAYYSVGALGFSVTDSKEFSGEIVLKFKTRMDLQSDWSLKTKTRSNGYIWLQKPVMKAGPVEIPIGFMADYLLKSNTEMLSAAIDQTIHDQFNLKKYASEAWSNIQKPQLISPEYDLWISIRPISVSSSPLQASKGKIIHKLNLKAQSECYTWRPPVMAEVPLPNLSLNPDKNDDFEIAVHTRMTYAWLNKQARQYIQGKSFEAGSRFIKIDSVNIYASNDRLIVQTMVSGSIKGTLYFRGIPVFDSATQSINIKEFDYDLSTRNILHRSANWLLEGAITRKINHYLTFPLKDHISLVKSEVNTYLAGQKLTDDITLKGNLKDILIGEVYLIPEGLIIPVLLKGRLQATFNSEP